MTRPRTILRRSTRAGARAAAVVAVGGVLIAIGAVAWLAGALPRGGDAPASEARSTGTPILVYAEYSETTDRIYTAPADAPNQRALLDTVPHAPGWAITPAPAIVGGLAAFTVLPPGSPANRNAPAELWVLTIEDGTRTRLARDADLLVPPVFSPDGASLLYRTALLEERQEIVRVNLETRARRVVHVEQSLFGVFPVGFDDAGRPLVARLSLDGTALLRIEHPEPPLLLRQLSDEIAREWRLSPDGSALVYVVPTIEREQVLWRPRALRTNDGGALPLELPSATYLSPLWEPTNGALTAGSLGGADADGVLVLRPDGAIAALEAASSGFDVPIAWSADGGWLAARHFEGTSIVEPGREAITVIGLDGTRRTIDLSREVIVIGWVGA